MIRLKRAFLACLVGLHAFSAQADQQVPIMEGVWEGRYQCGPDTRFIKAFIALGDDGKSRAIVEFYGLGRWAHMSSRQQTPRRLSASFFESGQDKRGPSMLTDVFALDGNGGGGQGTLSIKNTSGNRGTFSLDRGAPAGFVNLESMYCGDVAVSRTSALPPLLGWLRVQAVEQSENFEQVAQIYATDRCNYARVPAGRDDCMSMRIDQVRRNIDREVAAREAAMRRAEAARPLTIEDALAQCRLENATVGDESWSLTGGWERAPAFKAGRFVYEHPCLSRKMRRLVRFYSTTTPDAATEFVADPARVISSDGRVPRAEVSVVAMGRACRFADYTTVNGQMYICEPWGWRYTDYVYRECFGFATNPSGSRAIDTMRAAVSLGCHFQVMGGLLDPFERGPRQTPR